MKTERPARILIAEDDDIIRRMLETALSRDYLTIAAVGGYQALAATMKTRLPIDLIITDLDMPGLNGIELVENLLEDIPVIVVSAYLDNPDFDSALARLKPVAVFQKPFSIAGLRTKILEVLARPDASGLEE